MKLAFWCGILNIAWCCLQFLDQVAGEDDAEIPGLAARQVEEDVVDLVGVVVADIEAGEHVRLVLRLAASSAAILSEASSEIV